MNRTSTRNGRNNNGKSQTKESDRSNQNNSKKDNFDYKKQTIEFTPHVAGKHQTVTYDTVKEHILQEIQKELKNGSNIAVNLRKDKKTGMPLGKPKIQMVFKIKLEA